MVARKKPLKEAQDRYCSQGDTAGKRKDKIIFERAEGSFAYTVDGRRLLDMQMFNSSANFGYRSAAHEYAIRTQLQQLPGIGSEYLTRQRIELSAAIAVSIEERFGVSGRVHFSVSGAQAVEDALKIVAVTTGRRSVFAFEGGYHGRTLAAAAISSSYRYRHRFGSEGRAQFIPFPDCFRCAYGKTFPNCEYYCLGQFKRLLENEFCGVKDSASGALEFTAFIAEPVLGRGGYIAPPPEYFPRLRRILDEHNVLLIIDDIQMGFFRTGVLWSMERYGVTPDLMLFGKAITNGLFPVSGVWARNPLMAPAVWSPSSAHTTFAGHPIGMAAALATFSLIAANDFATKSEAAGRKLQSGLERMAIDRPSIARICRLGLALSIEICRPGSIAPWSELASEIKETCLRAEIEWGCNGQKTGIIITVGGFYDNMITLSPALTISDAEIEEFLGLFMKYFDRAVDRIATSAA